MCCTPPPRTLLLRRRLELSQTAMGERLGVSQATIARLEQGQDEPGPIALLLAQIERDLDGVYPPEEPASPGIAPCPTGAPDARP